MKPKLNFLATMQNVTNHTLYIHSGSLKTCRAVQYYICGRSGFAHLVDVSIYHWYRWQPEKAVFGHLHSALMDVLCLRQVFFTISICHKDGSSSLSAYKFSWNACGSEGHRWLASVLTAVTTRPDVLLQSLSADLGKQMSQCGFCIARYLILWISLDTMCHVWTGVVPGPSVPNGEP